LARATTARLFVAIDLPAGVREQLATWARRAAVASGLRVRSGGALRLTDARSLHLTVCFLGDRPTEEIEAIAGTLEGCAVAAGELAVGAPLWLPPRRPRTLSVEIRDHAGELAQLHAAVCAAISGVTTWKPLRQRFRPHVTVGRVRERSRAARETVKAAALPATPPLRFAPDVITLYRSWLRPQGAAHDALASCYLSPAGS
jgi:RNA 2',3'-cyclic 3'-phosphodiesterase